MTSVTPEARLRDLATERNPLGRSDPLEGVYVRDPNGKLKISTTRLAAAIEEPTRFRAGPDGGLYRYDGGVYLPDGEEHVRRTAHAMLAEAYSARIVKEVVNFYLDREVANPLSFDPDTGSIMRAANGIVNVRKQELIPYTFDNASTVQIPWVLVDGAECPQIDQFLMDCFDDDRAMVTFMYEVAGYCALTRNALRLAFLMYGQHGNNGKSIFLWLLSCLLGHRNVAAVPLQRLGGDDRFSPARLVGRLANICGDIGPQTAKDMSLFKQLTGGDRVQAERKFREPFEFISGATPVFSANEFPGSPDTTKAYKNRWVAVPWPREFEEDASMEYELKALGTNQAEMEGFMLQAYSGALRVVERGGSLEMPEAVRACTDRFHRAVDSFESFVADKLVLEADATTPGPAAFSTYKSYCTENGYTRPLGRNRFYEKLQGLQGVHRTESDKDRPFVGVRLTEYPGPEIVRFADADADAAVV